MPDAIDFSHNHKKKDLHFIVSLFRKVGVDGFEPPTLCL